MEKHYVSLSVRGDTVMEIARSKFYQENDLPYAIQLLMDCMVTDQLSPGDRLAMAIKILDGRMAMTGTYPIDFDIVEVEPKDPKYDFEGHFKAMNEKIKDLEEQVRAIRDNFVFVCEHMEEFELKNINRQYKREFGKPLFRDMPCSQSADESAERLNIVDAFIRQAEWERDNPDEAEYGWLAPDGTFYPVEFADHVEWACERVEKLYEQTDSETTRLHIRANSPDDYRLGAAAQPVPRTGQSQRVRHPAPHGQTVRFPVRLLHETRRGRAGSEIPDTGRSNTAWTGLKTRSP